MRTKLHDAVEANSDINKIRKLASDWFIFKGIPVNEQDEDGSTALSIAARKGNYGVVRCLVEEFNADVNIADTIEYTRGYTPLHHATSRGHTAVAKYLAVEGKADLTLTTNRRDDSSETAVVLAAQAENLELLECFIKKCGAQVNFIPQDKFDNLGINKGIGAIHRAASSGRVNSIKYLIDQCGADPNLLDGIGRNALLHAAYKGHVEAIRCLINDYGANVDQPSGDGKWTPSHGAAYTGKTAALRCLVLEFGADLNKQNIKGETPYDVASKETKKFILELIASKNSMPQPIVPKPVTPISQAPLSRQTDTANNVVSNSNTNQVDVKKSWHFDMHNPAYIEALNKGEFIFPASKEDWDKAMRYYHEHPVPGEDIRSVKVIYNKTINRAFELQLGMLQERHDDPEFQPNWQNESDSEWRHQVHGMFEAWAQPYKDDDYPNVKIIPGWHGTKSFEVVEKIGKKGFANLAKTDEGFFGKGLYFTENAEYARRVYSHGTLVMAWLCVFSEFPTIHSDMKGLSGKGNKENYDAHFAPVIPRDGNISNTTSIYHACKPNQQHQYFEIVLFESTRCLPRYVFELQPSMPKEPSMLPLLEASSNSQQFENTINEKVTGALAQMSMNSQKSNNNNSQTPTTEQSNRYAYSASQ